MTKDEAVQKLSTVGRLSIAHAEDLYDSFFPKPVVTQCIADWYERHKDEFEINLYREACESDRNYVKGSLTDFQKWLISGKTKPLQTLVNMHQFGYEVEKETKYSVKIKASGQHLYDDGANILFYLAYKGSFTRKELEEAGFGWVFSCEGIEIEEVD